MTLVVVDYGRGNLFSIGQALDRLSVAHQVSEDPGCVAAASRILLPGVGAFGDAMDGLRSRGLVAPLLEAAKRGVPVLGICLGMELLTSRSEEFGDHDGLGLIPGTVRRLPDEDLSGAETRIPNVGWRRLRVTPGGEFLGLPDDRSMTYFVHSYTPVADDPADVAATIDFNGHDIAAVIRRGAVVGYQFHPEKSADVGLGLIERFLALEATVPA